jgi:hypothetical protein
MVISPEPARIRIRATAVFRRPVAMISSPRRADFTPCSTVIVILFRVRLRWLRVV